MLRTLALASIPIAAFLACSPGTDSATTQGSGASSGSSHSGGTNSGGAGQGGDDISVGSASGGNTGSGGTSACATSSEKASLTPLNMFISVDISGSMNQGGKYDAAKAAFEAFFADPTAAGLNVALRFWPFNNCGLPACDPTQCAIPEVDIGPLSDPNHVKALTQAFEAKIPNNGTPTIVALQGATQWCSDYVAKKPGEKAVVVLVTDGDPNDCSLDPVDAQVQQLSKIADTAYQTSNVLTFVVGMQGAIFDNLNIIATGGHTNNNMAFDASQGQAALLAALKSIQGSVVACSFKMPDPPVGETLDPGKVNVEYTPGGGTKMEIGKVADAASCGAKEGWYYDNDKNPTSINLCKATCDKVQADAMAKIDVVLGCATKSAQ